MGGGHKTQLCPSGPEQTACRSRIQVSKPKWAAQDLYQGSLIILYFLYSFNKLLLNFQSVPISQTSHRSVGAMEEDKKGCWSSRNVQPDGGDHLYTCHRGQGWLFKMGHVYTGF